MEWYCLVTLTTSKCVARICQHQLSFLYVRRGACECRHYARQLWCFYVTRRCTDSTTTVASTGHSNSVEPWDYWRSQCRLSPTANLHGSADAALFRSTVKPIHMLPIELLKYTHDRAIFVSPWLSTSLWWCQTVNHMHKSQMMQETQQTNEQPGQGAPCSWPEKFFPFHDGFRQNY